MNGNTEKKMIKSKLEKKASNKNIILIRKRRTDLG